MGSGWAYWRAACAQSQSGRWPEPLKNGNLKGGKSSDWLAIKTDEGSGHVAPPPSCRGSGLSAPGWESRDRRRLRWSLCEVFVCGCFEVPHSGSVLMGPHRATKVRFSFPKRLWEGGVLSVCQPPPPPVEGAAFHWRLFLFLSSVNLFFLSSVIKSHKELL